MKRFVYMCMIAMICIICMGKAKVYGDAIIGSISNEVLEEISKRTETAIQAGSSYIDMTDLDIYVQLLAEDNCEVYNAINDTVCLTWQNTGFFHIGSYNESYCNYTIVTEPTEEAIALGNTYNKFMGVNISYNAVYELEDGSGDIAKIEQDKVTIKKEFNRALSVVTKDMSDFTKALLLHDYLVAYVNYPDGIGTYDDGDEYFADEHYTVAELFCRGQAVCCAYARAYVALLQECGIDAITVDNYDINHEWSMIKIDGEWYHVDATWDDARYDEGYTMYNEYNEDSWDIGACYHEYYLKTDKQMQDIGRKYWNVSYVGEVLEKEGDGYFLPKSATTSHPLSGLFEGEDYCGDSHFNYVNGYWYLLDGNNGNVVRIKLSDPLQYEYLNIETSDVIKYVYSYDEWLFICASDEIYVYDTKDYTIDSVITPSKISPLLSQEDRTSYFTEMNIVKDELNIVCTIGDDVSKELYSMYFTISVRDFIEDEETTSESTTSDVNLETTTTKEAGTKEDTDVEAHTTEINADNGSGDKDSISMKNIMIYVSIGVAVVTSLGLIITIAIYKKKGNS